MFVCRINLLKEIYYYKTDLHHLRIGTDDEKMKIKDI